MKNPILVQLQAVFRCEDCKETVFIDIPMELIVSNGINPGRIACKAACGCPFWEAESVSD